MESILRSLFNAQKKPKQTCNNPSHQKGYKNGGHKGGNNGNKNKPKGW